MRVTATGQIQIPQDIQEKLGLLPDTEVEFEVDGDAIRIRRSSVHQVLGPALIAHMRGRAGTGMSTDELMALTRGEE